jgi:CDP-diacylglycerol pyrophosphatase
MAGSGFTPPSDCGKDLDLDPLWVAAEAKIIDVHAPEPGKFKYVILDGAPFGWDGKYNKLLVPKVRITGIECATILQSDALNIWKWGWQDAQKAWPNVDILLGVNSYDGRTRNQLHVHLTALKRNIRDQLDKLSSKITGLKEWNDCIHELGPGLNGKTYVYRIAHVDRIDTVNPFNLLDQYVAAKCTPNDRFAQSLAVVAGTKGGYYLLATQGPPDTTHGQPQHKPVLSSGGNWGTTTAEGLMDRNWK